MKIGIVGNLGIVGSAIEFGFRKLGHEVTGHDIRLDTKLEDLLLTEIIYICVPTPANSDGSCNIKIVEEVFFSLVKLRYSGIIVIKSTVTPGTTDHLMQTASCIYNFPFVDQHVAFCAEFLRERCNFVDMVEMQKALVIGAYNQKVVEKIIECHGHYPKSIHILNPKQAELVKLYHNSINALRVVFANEMYDICNALNIEYTAVKNAVLSSTGMPDQYLDCNANMRGYSSICFNKDIPSLIHLSKQLGLELPIIQNIVNSNARVKATPFTGTRE